MMTSTILASCTGTKSRTEAPASGEIHVTDVIIAGDEEVIMGACANMVSTGNYLALLDLKADSVFHLFNTGKEARYLGEFGRKGNGPGEFGNIALLAPDHINNNSLIINSPQTGIVYTATIGESNDSVKLSYSLRTKLDNAWFVEQIGNGDYVTSNGYVDYPELFAVYDSLGQLRHHTGDRQIPQELESYPPIATTAAYQYGISVSPDGRHVAAIGTPGESAGFYRLVGDSLRLVNQFSNGTAEHIFADGEYQGVDAEKTPYGFLVGTCDNERVYILSSELMINDKQGFTGRTILVYDWEGNHKGSYTLDRRIRSFAASGEPGHFYAISEDGTDPILVEFTVPTN